MLHKIHSKLYRRMLLLEQKTIERHDLDPPHTTVERLLQRTMQTVLAIEEAEEAVMVIVVVTTREASTATFQDQWVATIIPAFRAIWE